MVAQRLILAERSIFEGNLEASILSPSKDAGLHRFTAGAAPFDGLRVLSPPKIRTHPFAGAARRSTGDRSIHLLVPDLGDLQGPGLGTDGCAE
jgi:hypothetical protein